MATHPQGCTALGLGGNKLFRPVGNCPQLQLPTPTTTYEIIVERTIPPPTNVLTHSQLYQLL